MKYIKPINEYFDDYDMKKKHSDYNLKDFDQPLRSYDIKINKDKKSNYVHIDLMVEQYIDSLKYFKLIDRKEEEGFYTLKYIFEKNIEDFGDISFEIEIHKMMTSYFVIFFPKFTPNYVINLEGEDDNIWKFKVNDEVKNEKYFPVILKKINKNIWYLSKYFEDKYSVELF